MFPVMTLKYLELWVKHALAASVAWQRGSIVLEKES